MPPPPRAALVGVRNHQARNFMRAMRVGDHVLFYYSSCKVPGVAGVVQVGAEPMWILGGVAGMGEGESNGMHVL
jgi:hypothetical protein